MAQILRDQGSRAAILESEPDYCIRCLGDGPLHTWPLEELTILGSNVCSRCWFKLVRGDMVVTWQRRVAQVATTHPVHGVLHRGAIRAVGIEPRELQPVIVWQIQDQDHHDLGELAGDYVDAQRMLLDATPWADRLDDNRTNNKE